MKIAVIQMNAQTDKSANLARALHLMQEAVTRHAPDLIVLPENFTCYTTDPVLMAANAEVMPGGMAYEALARFARQHRVAVHGGSMSEKTADKPFNTSVVFNRDGDEIARYRKIHRFDITAPDGTQYFESAVVGGGRDIVTYELDGLVFGCAICFDLRFDELFAALRRKGADAIVIPSAFTHATGEAHWNILIRARAIANQCYMIAPNQHGSFDKGTKANWGHSLMVDPWGAVLAEAGDGDAILVADISKSAVTSVRARIPIDQLHVLD